MNFLFSMPKIRKSFIFFLLNSIAAVEMEKISLLHNFFWKVIKYSSHKHKSHKRKLQKERDDNKFPQEEALEVKKRNFSSL